MSSIPQHYQIDFPVTGHAGLDEIRVGVIKGAFQIASGRDVVDTLNYLYRMRTHEDERLASAACKLALYTHISPCQYEYVEAHEHALMQKSLARLNSDALFKKTMPLWGVMGVHERMIILDFMADALHKDFEFQPGFRSHLKMFSMSPAEHAEFLAENNLAPEIYPHGQAITGVPMQARYPGLEDAPAHSIALNIHKQALNGLDDKIAAMETVARLLTILYQQDLKEQQTLGKGPRYAPYNEFLKSLTHEPSAWEGDGQFGRLFRRLAMPQRHSHIIGEKFAARMAAKPVIPERWSLSNMVDALQRKTAPAGMVRPRGLSVAS